MVDFHGVQRMRGYGAWLAALVVWVAACAQPEVDPGPTGSLQLMAVLPSAEGTESVTTVRVQVSAWDMKPVSFELTKTGGTWSGTSGPIPVGRDRTFFVEALDATNVRRFSGTGEYVTITSTATAVLSITLQEHGGGTAYGDQTPRITSLLVSDNRVEPGDKVALRADAMDPDRGETLTYAWTASAGSFDDATHPSPTWTAPLLSGSVTLTVTVTSTRGASDTLSFTLPVEAGDGSTGTASVGVVFNHTPRVTLLSASPTSVELGKTTLLDATVHDPDGDPLSYQWTTGCSGTWINATSRTAAFTPQGYLPTPGFDGCSRCYINLRVDDRRGGVTWNSLNICAGPKTSVRYPPVFTETSASATTVATGDTVTFRVAASAPQGDSVSFQWQADSGTLGFPVWGPASSEVVWTAPSCVPTASTVNIVAVAKGFTSRLSTPHVFTVTVTGPHPCPPSAWTFVGELDAARSGHTATLLPDGRVLVTGGKVYSAESSSGFTLTPSSELYDPATGLWVKTRRPMADSRAGHTATLLPTGQVLVVGGYGSGASSAELYDPVLDVWWSARQVGQGRVGHTATLLPNGKVLVVGGSDQSGVANLTSVMLYNPVAGSWEVARSLYFNRPRAWHTATLLPNGKVLVVGGTHESNLAELYDPAVNEWTEVPMPRVRGLGTLTALLPDGRVLVAGGRQSPLTSDVYDPVQGTWSPAGNPNVDRPFPKVLVLPNGKVLAVGGQGYASRNILASAEVYDPALDTWSFVESMPQGRSNHSVTLLPDGQVLVIGGDTLTGVTPGSTPLLVSSVLQYPP